MEDKKIDFRYYYDRSNGVSFATIEAGDNVYVGAARCSLNDNFSKKFGRKIAEGRAEHIMNKSSCQMTAIFNKAELLDENIQLSLELKKTEFVIILKNKS